MTRWRDVALLIAGGVVAAFAMGKAPIALPALQREFGLGAITESLILSVLMLIGALTGVLFGAAADRAGHRRLMIGGLLTIAAASAAGAFAPSAALLLLARFVEGLGLLSVVVSGPRLIVAAAGPARQRLALGLWSAYVPAGTALIMFAAPVTLAHGGWRALWVVAAIATGIIALAIAIVTKPPPPEAPSRFPLRDDVLAVVRARVPLALAIGFAGYAAAYLSLVGFLPTMLVDAGASVGLAGTVSALVVVANGTGNVLGGVIARRRGASSLIAAGAAIMGVCGAAAFFPALPIVTRLACASIAALAGGVIPASMMLSVPEAAPSPRLMATTQGLIVQGSSAGQLFGPVLVAAAGGVTGSPSAAALIFGLCAVSLVAANALRSPE